MMLEKGHPIYSLQSHLLLDKPGLVLEFSKYIHLGYGKTLSREIFNLRASELTESWLTRCFSVLKEEQELALHSRVNYKGKSYHIPMVDFINTTSYREVDTALAPMKQICSSDLWLCWSGQSLHGYYFELIEDDRWFDYLAKLLLCNQGENNAKDIVDQRWIAHSLEHRFSALRWSHNTSRYLTIPTFYSRQVLPTRQDV